jgi:3-deoxy-manno-octulosonate cytidylyltransferase (CMP-KDO synthetase)
MRDLVIVIPARMHSTRLPRKPLLDVAGKSILQRTYEQCTKAISKESVYVATDHTDIERHCIEQDMNVIMTSEDCLTGTDRVAEFSQKVLASSYINVQGDEPLINPDDITLAIEAVQKYPGEIINGYSPIKTEEEYRSPHTPKVVFRPDGRLLYMSRSPIPGNKKMEFRKAWRQICIYGFPKNLLQAFQKSKRKSPLEEEEDIEILRFMELGYDVRMIRMSDRSIPVDTEDDLRRVREHLNS